MKTINTLRSKSSLIIMAIVTMLTLGGRAQAQQVSLEVHLSGFKNDQGMAKVSLYDREDHFLKKALQTQQAVIKNGKAEVKFTALNKGTYAVSAYHDENGNAQMDRNSFGMPLENYGCSNNAKGFMGPPKFEDAKVSVQADSKLDVSMN